MRAMVLDVVFAQRIARFIGYKLLTKKYDETRMKIFVDKVGVSSTAILKWATGAVSPPPMKKKLAEEFLNSWTGQP